MPKKPIVFTKKELETLLNLARELHGMLVSDYYHTFDLQQAGKYSDKLAYLLAKKQGKNPEGTKSQRQKWTQELKQDWKDYACEHCGYLVPNTWQHQQNGCPDCQGYSGKEAVHG